MRRPWIGWKRTAWFETRNLMSPSALPRPTLSERSKVSPVLTTYSNSIREHANAASAFCMTSRSPTFFRIRFPGNVNGVVVKSKNHEVIYIRGNAVVIATGGYSANNALCRKFNPEISALMPSTAIPEEDILTELGAMRWNLPSPSTQLRLIWIRFKGFAFLAVA